MTMPAAPPGSDADSPPAPPVRIFRTPEGRSITIEVDGRRIPAIEGETLAAAMMAGRSDWTMRVSEHRDHVRGVFCGMGVCQECTVFLQGGGMVLACMTAARDEMVIQTLSTAQDRGYPGKGPDL